YNGFKMVLAGRAIYGDDIQKLRQRIESEDYATGLGRAAEMDILPEYRHRIVSDAKLARPMKIVVDSGNGIPGASAPGILRALDVLKRVKHGTIIYDVKCTQRLAPIVREAGGQPLMWRTGHSLIKAKLKETGAPLAGEMSGHIFFAERWYGFDDATYSAARLL